MERRAAKVCRLYDGRMGRAFIAIGVALVVLGLLVTFGERLPIRLGRLPGDIVIRGKNTTFYFPLVTSLLVSALLSAVMWLIGRR
jgi:hypothetical protein